MNARLHLGLGRFKAIIPLDCFDGYLFDFMVITNLLVIAFPMKGSDSIDESNDLEIGPCPPFWHSLRPPMD